MPMDDATLLKRWTRRRDTEAFNEIVERFAGQVYVTCRRVLNNDADAEEVAQECFFALARSSGDVRSSLGGWLHRAATYKSRDRIRGDVRRRNRERAYSDLAPEAAEPVWDDIREHVDEAIEALPEELREAVVAHYLGRKSHAEIAAEYRVTRRAVSYRIQRGLEAVRRELRRRGVALSAVALGASLAEDAIAAPLSLKASLGKLAIAAGSTSGGAGATAGGSLLGSLMLMKAKSLLVSGVLIAFAIGAYFALTRTPPTAGDGYSGPKAAGVSGASEAIPTSTGAPAPPLAPASAPGAKTSSLSELLALSRRELERALEHYPPIKDPAQYASVSGVALDQNGYGVPGAAIALVPSYNWGMLPGADGIARTAASGADGVYRIDHIQRGGSFRVVASKPGFASEAHYTSIEAGKDVTVDFTMKNGPSIQGRVVSASGEPVPSAFVYCIGLTGPRQLVSDQQRAAQTDREGHFTLGFTEKERGFVAAVRVQSSNYGAATFPDVMVQDGQPIELRLAAPAVIRGTVKDRSGKPVSGARLTFFAQKSIDIKRDDGAVWSSPAFAGAFIAVCDGSGQYATEVDAELDFQVKVEVQGVGDGSERMDKIAALAAGETREYNAVFNTNCITVRASFVGQQSGQPFADYVPVEVVAFGEGKLVARSQQDGPFDVRIVLPGVKGKYTFQARYLYDSDVTGDMSAPYKLNSGDEIGIKLNLPDPQSFAVRTVDPSGRPVEGARIEFLTETSGGGPVKYGQTNAEGRLDKPILFAPLSGAQLLVEMPGYALARGPAYTDQSPGAVHPEETIVLWPGAGFEGVLLDNEKRPLADTALTISVTNRDGQLWSLQATTDSGGHFTVVSQAPADLVDIAIATRDGSGKWVAKQLQLTADAITSLGELTLE